MTRVDRMMTLKRQIEAHKKNADFLNEMLSPYFDAENFLNINNFSSVFEDPIVIQYKINS